MTASRSNSLLILMILTPLLPSIVQADGSRELKQAGQSFSVHVGSKVRLSQIVSETKQGSSTIAAEPRSEFRLDSSSPLVIQIETASRGHVANENQSFLLAAGRTTVRIRSSSSASKQTVIEYSRLLQVELPANDHAILTIAAP